MPQINIQKCPKCQGYLLAKQGQKTKTCPYCGVNVDLKKAQRIASAKNAYEASEMLKDLKTKKGFDIA